MEAYKVILVGDVGVGKTSYLERFRSGHFLKQYIATYGVEEYPLVFSTNYGLVRFTVVDVSGQEKFGGVSDLDRHFSDADAAIIMFDVNSRLSYKNLGCWNGIIDEKLDSKSIPRVVCGNKVELGDRKVKVRSITWPRRKGYHYCEISTKSMHNFEKPFLYLVRQLSKHEDLIFA